jgi:transposase
MRIVNHWVEEALEDVDLSEIKSIGIDETSSKKGHNYVTVVADISERKVIDVQVSKDKPNNRKVCGGIGG